MNSNDSTVSEPFYLVEPAASFYHAQFKIRWAMSLLRNLKNDYQRMYESVPHITKTRYNEDNKTTNVNITANVEVPWPTFCIAGDVIGNLRSSLDYCWMGIVRADRQREVRRVNFASGSDRNELIKCIKKDIKGDLRRRVIKHFLLKFPTHRDYHNGGLRDFFVLNDLANWQKHNRLPITRSSLILAGASLRRVGMPNANFPQDRLAPGETLSFDVPGFVTDQVGDLHEHAFFDMDGANDTVYITKLENLCLWLRGVVLDFMRSFPETIWYADFEKPFGKELIGKPWAEI